jgi:hypothetical protein
MIGLPELPPEFNERFGKRIEELWTAFSNEQSSKLGRFDDARSTMAHCAPAAEDAKTRGKDLGVTWSDWLTGQAFRRELNVLLQAQEPGLTASKKPQ